MQGRYKHYFSCCCCVYILLLGSLSGAAGLPARNVDKHITVAAIPTPVALVNSTAPLMRDDDDQEEGDSNEIRSQDVYAGVEPSDQEISYQRFAFPEGNIKVTTDGRDTESRTSDDTRSPQAIAGITVAVLVIVGVTLRVYCVRRKDDGADFARTTDLESL